ncbi:MAG: aminocarboxymuconate-semialdehyde decarboxylase [Actinomycetota bacterium]|nr:aminocarboxymuconate-semialdehyde decarboxylase [Actinomycetota bacterium]
MPGSHPLVIDLHSHVATPACQALVEGLASPLMDPFAFYSGEETKSYNAAHFAALVPKLTDPARRLEDMDRMGVDLQVLSVAPPQYYYWADPALGRRLARLQNEHLAELVAGRPDRFAGLATVPLQDVDAAVAELDHAVGELGLRGVEICTNVNGLDLDDRRFRPFFARVAELGVVVLLHPHGFTQGERLMDYYLTNVIGNPLESTIAVTRMIHGGVLEEFPGLNLCVVHGGGYLPFYASRMDHAWRQRPEGRHHIPDHPPSSYLRRIHVDCLVYDPAHLAFLVSQLGADRVVVGTDYPYDMGFYDPVGLVEGTPSLSPEDRRRILGGNAASLLGLDG